MIMRTLSEINKRSSEAAYNIASRKIRKAGQKRKKYYDKGQAKKA